MTDTDKTDFYLHENPNAAAEQAKSAALTMVEQVMKIPLIRWSKITRRFDCSMDEALEQMNLIMILAANEKHRADTNRAPVDPRGDDYERFEAMSLIEAQEYLGIADTDALEKALDDATSDDQGDDDGEDDAPKSGAVLDRGEGLPAGAGQGLPGAEPLD